MLYPICLDIKNKLCVVIGGGVVAERKVRGLLSSDAKIRVISPNLCQELFNLHQSGLIDWHERPFKSGDLEGAFLVFAATDNEQIQARICDEAEAGGYLLNIVDSPSCCSFQVPASLRRGDLIVSVSTGGKSPAIASMVRTQLEKEFGSEYGVLLDIVNQVRLQVLEEDMSTQDKKNLFQNLLHPDIVQWIREDQWDKVQEHFSKILDKDLNINFRVP